MPPSISEIHKRTLRKEYLSIAEIKKIIEDQKERRFDVRLLNELLFHLSFEVLLTELNIFSIYNPVNNHEEKSSTILLNKAQKMKKINIGLIGTNVFHFLLPFVLLNRTFKVKVVWVKEEFCGLPSAIVNGLIIKMLGGITIKREQLASEKMISLKDYIVFHKLNFIIPKDVIEFFTKGIINDHWGTLPYYRGRSTFEYQSMFNHRKMFTNHLIAEGIDSGRIISYTPVGQTVWWSKYFKLYERIKLSTLRLSLESDALYPNDLSQGATFYKMHVDLPRLVKFANQKES